MTHAIRIHETGGPEVLKWEEVEVGEPGPDEVLLRHTFVGLNFLEVYFRSGLYPAPHLPFTPASEGAGVVEAVGSEVEGLAPGDRVAYGSSPPGAYAERRVIPARVLVKLPDAVDDRAAAAMMLKGMTVEYLLTRTYPVQRGDTILFHAAAGGVGLIACQWAKALGAIVIGTVGSDEKAELARAHGCDHPIVYTREAVAERVREITHGEGVPVVYDAVGKDTLEASLDSLRPFGTLVSFGNASGPVTNFNPGVLAQKGSLYLTRPTLFSHAAVPGRLQEMAGTLFELVASGKVKIEVNQTYPLRDASRAHADLEARKTVGSTVLTV